MKQFQNIRRYLVRVSRTALFLICVVSTVPAQTNEVTPESIAERYTAATRSGDWLNVAQLIHPEALTQLKQMFAPLVAAEPQKFGASFFGVRSKQEYDQLSDVTVFERFMLALVKQVPEMGVAMSTSEMKIVGHVREQPDLAHIVYRMNTKVGDISVSKTAVMTLKKNGESWRALLSGNIEGMAAALSRPQNAPDKLPNRTRN